VDVLWHLIKDDQWRDNPPNPGYTPTMPPHHSQTPLYTTDRPEVLDVVAGLRRVLDEFGHRVLIGEIYLPVNRLMAYYGHDLNGAHLPFNFQLLQSAWSARGISELIDNYERALPRGGWPNWVLGNHDNPRLVSRVGQAQARVAAMLLLTLRGTPTLYYGDEIGMANVPIAADRVRDPFERNVPGQGLGRDPCRTPMQWDGSLHAGFTGGEPWLPVADDYAKVNVAAEDRDPTSDLFLYRRLLQLRRTHPALSVGDYEPVAAAGDLLAYVRHTRDERVLIVLNLGGHACALPFGSVATSASILLSTHSDRRDEVLTGSIALRPNEGVIATLPPRPNEGVVTTLPTRPNEGAVTSLPLRPDEGVIATLPPRPNEGAITTLHADMPGTAEVSPRAVLHDQ
jgi:alpha-glucosidase